MLNDDVARYIELRRAMGFRLRVQACLLRSFAAFAAERGDVHVRTETVLAWAAQAPSATQRRNRLQVVCGFARQLKAEDERHEVPPTDAFGRPKRMRRMPHIYSSDEIRRLLEAASALTPIGSIRPGAYVTLIALLASTGLRISEALALQLDDVTPSGLVIRCTKFRKSRLVPLHPTTRRGLDRYLALRTQISSADRSIFVSLRGTAIAYQTVNAVFLRLARAIGMRDERKNAPGPRLHDLRHTFAVRALEACGGGESEIRRHILALSTYLGHAHPSDTYWYLHATPKLMAEIARAGEELFNGGEA